MSTNWKDIESPFGTMQIAFVGQGQICLRAPSNAPIAINRIKVTGSQYFDADSDRSTGWKLNWNSSWLHRASFPNRELTENQRRKFNEWAREAVPAWAAENATLANEAEIANLKNQLESVRVELAALNDKAGELMNKIEELS